MEIAKFYDDMLTNISIIRYINLYNTKNDKSIRTSFNEINNIFIFYQKDNIIINQKVYQICYNFNIETDMCESLFDTIMTIDSKTIFISNSTSIDHIEFTSI